MIIIITGRGGGIQPYCTGKDFGKLTKKRKALADKLANGSRHGFIMLTIKPGQSRHKRQVMTYTAAVKHQRQRTPAQKTGRGQTEMDTLLYLVDDS